MRLPPGGSQGLEFWLRVPAWAGPLTGSGNTRPFPKPPSLHLKKETPDNGIPLSGLLSELSDRQTQSVCTVPGTHQRCSPDAGSPHVLPWEEGRSQQLTVMDVDRCRQGLRWAPDLYKRGHL